MNAITVITDRLDAIEIALNGNGKPGLKTEVAVIQKQIEVLQKMDARLARLEKVMWGGLGAVGGLQVVLKLVG